MAAPILQPERIIARLDELPTLASIVYELSQVINNPMSSTSDVEVIMQNDQSMTAKVLKLVNSAYYAIPGGVSSLGRAIAYIGFDTIHQLVLSSSIISALETKKGPSSFDINSFWKHAVGSAIAAETIAKVTSHPMPSDMFTCGLVHDMGKVALFSLAPEMVEQISQHAKEKNITFTEAEVELGLSKHTEIGKLLAEKWMLPGQIQAVIRYHHQKDPRMRGGIAVEYQRAVDIVLLANLLIHGLKFGNSGYDKVGSAPKEVMERLGIDPTAGLRDLVLAIKTNLEKASDFIRVLGG